MTRVCIFVLATVRSPTPGIDLPNGALTVSSPLIGLEGYTVFGLVMDAYRLRDDQLAFGTVARPDDIYNTQIRHRRASTRRQRAEHRRRSRDATNSTSGSIQAQGASRDQRNAGLCFGGWKKRTEIEGELGEWPMLGAYRTGQRWPEQRVDVLKLPDRATCG